MAKIALIRQGNGFFPATKSAQVEAEKIRQGVPLHGDIAARRNMKFHRLYWALCTYLSEALNSGPGDIRWTQEMVSDRLKIATGRADMIELSPSMRRKWNAQIAVKPQSVSFASMDEAEFGAFVEASIAFVLTEFGDWVQEHEDWAHVRDILHHATGGQ